MKTSSGRDLVVNRRARHEFLILDRFEAELDAIPGNLGTQRLLETVREVLAGRGVSSPRVAGLSPSDRSAGVLLPVSALGGAGPIGDLDAAIDFIDWLAEAGVGLWQVLPLVPTDSHGSPYSSGSALSGNPDLVGLQGCIEAGLLDPSSSLPRTERVDYEATARAKRPLVLQAARALLQRPDHPWSIDLRRFARQAHWATEAATFHAIKWALDGAPWWAWPEPLARGDAEAVAQAREELADQIRTWRAALLLFERQWARVRSPPPP